MKVVQKAETEVFSYMQKDHRIRKLFLKLLDSMVFLGSLSNDVGEEKS